MTGRLIAVVGPSGVGKDSVMAALAQARPSLGLAQRVITRDPAGGGEIFTPVTVAQFLEMEDAGAFCLSWQAHGLCYGVPVNVLADVKNGAERLVNLSRSVLTQAKALHPQFVVLNVTAKPETLALRLMGRGRETAEDIERRLARATYPLPPDLPAIDLPNDGPIADTVARALAALYPVSVS